MRVVRLGLSLGRLNAVGFDGAHGSLIVGLSRWLRTKSLHLIKMRVQGQTVITEIYLSPMGVGLWGRLGKGFQAAAPLDVIPPLFVLCLFIESLELVKVYSSVIKRQD